MTEMRPDEMITKVQPSLHPYSTVFIYDFFCFDIMLFSRFSDVCPSPHYIASQGIMLRAVPHVGERLLIKT